MDYVLQTYGLSKKYKGKFAVNNANMNILKGDIYGFVGENGSGKTTIIRMITGLISPNSGNFKLFGVNNTDKAIYQAKRNVSAIVETPSVYKNMSAYDNLKLQSGLLGIKDDKKIQEVLAIVGLEELYKDKKKVNNFSLGMRQRIGIAMALIGDPKFIILDEPMNGLDPAGIVDIRELILKLNREKNITFLISSHILTELSLVATKYGIISKGHIIEEITAEELREKCLKTTSIVCDKQEELEAIIKRLYPENEVCRIPQGVKIVGNIDLNQTLCEIINHGDIIISSINCNEQSIEDYYLSVIGGARHV